LLAIGVVTGEVGTGKTVAIRAAVAGLDPAGHTIVYVGNPATGVRGILAHVVTALGGRPVHSTAALAAQAWNTLAGESAERGRTPVLILDEAHMLDHEQLESIRMLTNHDMDSSTPFATILVGQPTPRHNIKLGVLAALDQRITVRYQMKGMTPTRPPATSATTSRPRAAPPTCSPTTRSPRSTRPPAASPEPSTTSASPP
jgi:type II secretory pathway predicted ATPase ExeA